MVAGAVLVPVTMEVDVDTPGVAVMTVVGMEVVGAPEMVELDADHCRVEEGVELTMGVTMLDEEVLLVVVTGSGVETTGVELGVALVVGSVVGSAEDEGSAEVVGTAEVEVRGQSTAVGLHLVTVTSWVVVDVRVVVERSSCAATRVALAAMNVTRPEKRILAKVFSWE